MFDCSHTIIGGFLQNFSNPGNGLPGIEYKLKQLSQKSDLFIEVNYYQWLIEAKDYAQRCFKFGINRYKNYLCKFHFVGYSFGGQTVSDICWAMYALQVPIQKVCLIDPVRRNSRYPWGYWKALHRNATFKLPPNIEEVIVIRQESDTLIRGHRVIPANNTKFQDHLIDVPHQVIDNSPLVRSLIYKQALELHNSPILRLENGNNSS